MNAFIPGKEVQGKAGTRGRELMRWWWVGGCGIMGPIQNRKPDDGT